MSSSMSVVNECILPPKQGHSLVVRRGQHVRVTDLEGRQVVDMAVFRAENHREALSTSYSRTRQRPKLGEGPVMLDRLSVGHILLSTLCRPLMTIIDETPEEKGVHDVHGRMCNRFLYEMLGHKSQDGCHEIIAASVERHGIPPEDIPDTMDLFMNYHHSCGEHRWIVDEPISRPGDCIEFRAETDCLVAFSNCPDEVAIATTNGGRCTPVKIEVRDSPRAT